MVYKDHVVDHVVYQDKIIDKIVYVKVQAKAVHKETTTTKAKDGTVVTRVVEDDHTDTSTKKDEDKIQIKYVDRVIEKEVIKTVEKEKIVTTAKPQWRAGAMVGIDFVTVLGGHAQPLPQLGPVVIGIEAERRIAGPFSLGVWGTTSAQAGILANIEW